MKRQIRILTALFAAALLTACGDQSIPDEPVAHIGETTTAATTTTTAGETTTSAAETTAATTTAAETTSAPVDTAAEAAVTTEAAGGTESSDLRLLPELLRKIRENNGYVTIKLHAEVEGESYDVYEVYSRDKFYTETAAFYGFNLKYCSDGTHCWMIDDETRSYAELAEMIENPSVLYTEMPENDVDGFLGSGKDMYEGKKYRYEDYTEDNDGEDSNVRFFFDAEGNLIGAKMLTGEDAGTALDYVMRVDKSVDQSLFSPPASYKQVTQMELMNGLSERMWGGIGTMEDMPQITRP